MKIINATILTARLGLDRFNDPTVAINFEHDDGGTFYDFSLDYSHKEKAMGDFLIDFILPKKQYDKLLAYTESESYTDLVGKSCRVLISGHGGLADSFIGFGHPTDNDFVIINHPNLLKEAQI